MGQEQSTSTLPHVSSEPKLTALNLDKRVVLVLGGTSVVGQGAVFHFLHHGAKVLVATRHESKLPELFAQYPNYVESKQLMGFVTKYESKDTVLKTLAEIKQSLSKEEAIDHVVSCIGDVSLGMHFVTKLGVSESDSKILFEEFNESLFPTLLASQVYLPELKEREGSTYTIVSGGCGKACTFPGAWAATIKDAAMDALISSLISETTTNKVRVNGCSVHYGLTPMGMAKKSTHELQDTNVFGNVFLRVIQKGIKGEQLSFKHHQDAEQF